MLIPMPSPKGSNHARLFIEVPSGPKAAYDAVEGWSESTSVAKQLLAFLKDKLGTEDFADVETLLSKPTADDWPPEPAMDARLRRRGSFNTRFPDAARIKTAM